MAFYSVQKFLECLMSGNYNNDYLLFDLIGKLQMIGLYSGRHNQCLCNVILEKIIENIKDTKNPEIINFDMLVFGLSTVFVGIPDITDIVDIYKYLPTVNKEQFLTKVKKQIATDMANKITIKYHTEIIQQGGIFEIIYHIENYYLKNKQTILRTYGTKHHLYRKPSKPNNVAINTSTKNLTGPSATTVTSLQDPTDDAFKPVIKSKSSIDQSREIDDLFDNSTVVEFPKRKSNLTKKLDLNLASCQVDALNQSELLNRKDPLVRPELLVQYESLIQSKREIELLDRHDPPVRPELLENRYDSLVQPNEIELLDRKDPPVRPELLENRYDSLVRPEAETSERQEIVDEIIQHELESEPQQSIAELLEEF